jgi:hypothetical protein
MRQLSYMNQPAYGHIPRQHYQADCYIALPALRMYTEPLSDLADVRPLPRTLARIVEYSKAWLRVLQQRLRQHSGVWRQCWKAAKLCPKPRRLTT